MGKFNNILLIITLTLVMAVSATSCVVKNQQSSTWPVKEILLSIDNPTSSPQAVFLESWKIINKDYYDQSHNGQNWSRWKDRYIDQIKTKEDAYVAVDSMLESLDDPYSRFLSPSEFKEQDMNIESKLFGIGVNIATIRGNTVIIHVIDNTPAMKAGLKVGDIISKVNGVSVKGYNIRKVADLVRGKAGTHVKLTILRDKRLVVRNITRKKIDIKSVEYKLLDKKYAYIKILSFISQETSDEVAQALEKSKNAQGVIIDLRGNYGGLLPNAILISSMFIKKGPVVSIVDKNGYKDTINSPDSDIFTNKPMVVLINGASASASEILAGALKDHKRAVLVGEKTFGKGLVQRIYQLSDGSGINLTIAKYLTPNGNDINKKGIQPDYKVKLTEKDFKKGLDPQLAKAKQVLAMEISKNHSATK